MVIRHSWGSAQFPESPLLDWRNAFRAPCSLGHVCGHPWEERRSEEGRGSPSWGSFRGRVVVSWSIVWEKAACVLARGAMGWLNSVLKDWQRSVSLGSNDLIHSLYGPILILDEKTEAQRG